MHTQNNNMYLFSKAIISLKVSDMDDDKQDATLVPNKDVETPNTFKKALWEIEPGLEPWD